MKLLGQGKIRSLLNNKAFLICAGVVLVIVILGIVGPEFVGDPTHYHEESYADPSSNHWLGTNHSGQDILARLLHGLRNSLYVGFIASVIGIAIATFVGGYMAYKGGLHDESANVATNVIIVFPLIPLLIVIMALFGARSLLLVALIVGVVIWPRVTRQIRSQVLSLKNREFINLSLISGDSEEGILIKEVFPNMLAYVFISWVGIFAGAILTEAGISLLGLGPTDAVTLGIMLNRTISYGGIIGGYWHWFIPPGLILVLLAGFLIIMGSVMDEELNPKLKGVLTDVE